MTESINIELAAGVTLSQAIEKFWEAFPPVWNRIRGNLRLILAREFSVTIEEFHILRHLRRGYCSGSELATGQQVSRPAASQAVEGLVQKGLVSRHYDARDRRHIRLALTATGNEMLNSIFQKNRGWMMEKMAFLNSEEIAAVARAMETLSQAFLEQDA